MQARFHNAGATIATSFRATTNRGESANEATLVNTSSYLRLTELEVPYGMIHPDMTEAESGIYPPVSTGYSYRSAETRPSLEARSATPMQMP
jgi:hypothetical protein